MPPRSKRPSPKHEDLKSREEVESYHFDKSSEIVITEDHEYTCSSEEIYPHLSDSVNSFSTGYGDISGISDSTHNKKIDTSADRSSDHLSRHSIHSNQYSPKQPRHRVSHIQQHSTTPSDTGHPRPDNDNCLWMIMYLAVLLCALLVIYFQRDEPVVPEKISGELTDRQNMLQEFTDKFVSLKQSFPSQSKRTWATIGAGSKSVLRTENPSQPGIILFAASSSAAHTMNCLTKKLSEILADAHGSKKPTVFVTGDHEDLNAASLKLKIDETFRRGLGMEGSHVAILHNLEKVPGHAAMMFHAYCDNESAPFKDAIIIFTMVLPLTESEVLSMEEKEIQRYVEAQLQQVWERDIGYDNTMALRSRVANGIGIVKAEKTVLNDC